MLQKKVQLKFLRVEMRPLLSKKVNIVSTCIKISSTLDNGSLLVSTCIKISSLLHDGSLLGKKHPLDFCFDFNHNASLQKKKVYQLSGLMQ